MGNTLSKEVKQALQDIYYNERAGRGKEAFAFLEKASDAGDGDASCVLARCLSGHQYVWAGHGFPEDDARATALLHKSVRQGSALGVLVSMRCGELTPEVEKTMPFANLQEAFDAANALAGDGDAFCQYVVANSYFWWDFLRIQEADKKFFRSPEDQKIYMRENISKCEELFWKAFRGGMYFAANNLNRYYTKGDEDFIAPQPEKAKDIWKIGAEYGYPIHQSIYAKDLEEAGQNKEALEWYKRAAEGGQPGAWGDVGRFYYNGIGTEKDERYAASCFEKGVQAGETASYNMLGRSYFYGRGVAQDYGKAFALLSYGYEKGSNWGAYYLGRCYYEGWGVAKDYAKAKECLERVDWNSSDTCYLFGMMYTHGLGVAEDIPKGVAYLQSAGNHKEAREELLHYKKTLFGKWVRR